MTAHPRFFAWFHLALVPIGMILSQLVGHFVAVLLGIPEEGILAGPLGIRILMSFISVVFPCLPAVLGLMSSVGILRQGARWGLIPLSLNAVALLFFLLVGVLAGMGIAAA